MRAVYALIATVFTAVSLSGCGDGGTTTKKPAGTTTTAPHVPALTAAPTSVDREAAVAALNWQYQRGHPTNSIAEAGVLLRMLDGWNYYQHDVTAYDQAAVWGGSTINIDHLSAASSEISASLLNQAVSDPKDLDRNVCVFDSWVGYGPPVGLALDACVVDPALMCSYPGDADTNEMMRRVGDRCGSVPPQKPQDQLIETLQEQETNISCASWAPSMLTAERRFGYNEIVLNGKMIDMSIRNAQFGEGCRPIQAMVRICDVCSSYYVGDVKTEWDPKAAFETHYNVPAPPLIWFDRHNATVPFGLSCDRQPSHDECVCSRQPGCTLPAAQPVEAALVQNDFLAKVPEAKRSQSDSWELPDHVSSV